MNENPFVSVIIICEEYNSFLEEALKHYKKLNYTNMEVLVFTTAETEKEHLENHPKIKFINDPVTKNKPAEKRDLAIKYAKGEIFAFIDDDAFPSKDWLKNAVKNFSDDSISAVGGPGETPENAGIMEKASGWTSASPLGGFGTTHRFTPQNKKYIDDHPSMNLLVRAKDFKSIRGFDSLYYPGEDTKLCLDLTRKLGKKIVYDPETLVFHHKRPLFRKHLIQNGRYGLHRGHFARILPETSRRPFYFIPSLFFLGFAGGIVLTIFSLFFKNLLLSTLSRIFMTAFGIYVLLLASNAIWIFSNCKNIHISLLSFPGVFLTHLWYGLRFIQGYFSKRMNDTYGRI